MVPPEIESVVFSLMRRIDKVWGPPDSSCEAYTVGDESLKMNVRSSFPSRTYDKGESVKFRTGWSNRTVPRTAMSVPEHNADKDTAMGRTFETHR